MRNSKRNFVQLQNGAELLPDECFKFDQYLRKGDELSHDISQLPEHAVLSRRIDTIALFINNVFANSEPSEYEKEVINDFKTQFPDRNVHEAELQKLLNKYYDLLQTM